jgi:hypothetical protein
VPGQFAGNEADDLLFYDPVTGEGVFYCNDGRGEIKQVRRHSGWRKSWSLIIPGNFSDNPCDDLLFYDAESGEAEFYSTDGQGNMNLLKRHRGWRKTWSHIVPGTFGGNGHTDLLFYDPAAGEVEVYGTDGQGNISRLHNYTGWRKTWTHIVSMPSNPSWAFCFDRTLGEVELYCSSSTTRPKGKLYRAGRQSNIKRSWTHLVVGDFRGGTSFDDALFYNSATGEAEVYNMMHTDSLMKLLMKHTGWHRGWSLIVPGDFIVTDRGNTDLLFYDRVSW